MQFIESLDHCHTYFDFVILEQSMETIQAYFRKKRQGLIDADQIEIFNQPREEHEA